MTKRACLLALLSLSCTSPADPVDAGRSDAADGVDAAPRTDGAVADAPTGIDAPARDAGCASCLASECCVDAACVPADEDGDGYRQAACGEAGPADCDDDDAALAPFPPRALSFVAHGEARSLRELHLAATADDCAVAAYLTDDGTLELDRLAGTAASCRAGTSPAPIDLGTIDCGAGSFVSAGAIDLAARGAGLVLALAGDCSVDPAPRVALANLDGVGGDFDVVVLDGATDVAIVPGTGTAPALLAIRESDSEIQLASTTGLTQVRMTSTGDWLAGAGDLFLFADNAVLSLVGRTASTLRDESGLSSRAALVHFGADQYGVLVHRGVGELAMVGPLTGANGLDAVGPPVTPWPLDGADARLDAVALDDARFVVVGNAGSPSGLRVALGRRAGALSIEGEAVIDRPGDGAPLVELAVVAHGSGARSDVWIAAISDRLYSAHFAICAP